MDAKLRDLIDRLTEAYNPERIYLFGSRVWGDISHSSDYDILVELDASTERILVRSKKGYRSLIGFGEPVDLLVYTTDELQTRAEEPSSLIAKIIKSGKVIYAKS